MKIAYVMDPLETVVVGHDTTFALLLEAQGRGHENFVGLVGGLGVETDRLASAEARTRAFGEFMPVTGRAQQGDHYAAGPRQRRYLDEFDVIWMRKDPPFNMQYVFATYMLEQAGPRTLVVNSPAGIRAANEKLAIHLFPDLVPASIVTANPREVREFVRRHGGRAIIKPLDVMGGYGVFQLDERDSNFGALIEASTEKGRSWRVVQEVVDISGGDKRIMLLDGEVLGAISRHPPQGEFRANMAAGAEPRPAQLSAADRRICERLAPWLKKEGLYFTGIDVIDGRLTEINVTSPTGICEIDKLCGLQTVTRVVEWLEHRAAA